MISQWIGFLSGPQTWFATEVVVITDGWSRRSFVPLAIKSHSAWCCWMKISCAPCPLLWIAGACRADLLEQQNFCYYWRRQVANHLGWKERRGEGDVDNFNAEVNRVLWESLAWSVDFSVAQGVMGWHFLSAISSTTASVDTTMLGLSIKILGMNRHASDWVPKKRKGPSLWEKMESFKVEASITAERREFASV